MRDEDISTIQRWLLADLHRIEEDSETRSLVQHLRPTILSLEFLQKHLTTREPTFCFEGQLPLSYLTIPRSRAESLRASASLAGARVYLSDRQERLTVVVEEQRDDETGKVFLQILLKADEDLGPQVGDAVLEICRGAKVIARYPFELMEGRAAGRVLAPEVESLEGLVARVTATARPPTQD